MGCQYIYKDADGRPSAIYERALAKHGPEIAEEIYIRHMMSTMDTRFSQNTYDPLFPNAEARGDQMVDDGNGGVYKLADSGEEVDRVTALLDKYTVFEGDPPALGVMDVLANRTAAPVILDRTKGLEIGKERQARELLKATKLTNEQQKEGADAALAELLLKEPNLLEDAKKDVQTLWDAQNTWGTDLHDVIKDISIEWQLLADKQPLGTDGKRIPLPISMLRTAIDTAKLRYEEKWTDENGEPKFWAHNLEKSLKPIYEFVLSQSAKIGKQLILKPEFKIFSKKFKDPTSGRAGIGGTIDLLLVTEDKSHTYTVDFKTKASHKARNFDKTTGKHITKIFEPGLADTPENRAEAQQLIYSVILSDPAYNFHVDGTLTVVLPLSFTSDNQKTGENKYRVGEVKEAIVGPADTKITEKIKSTENKLESITSFFVTGDLRTTYETARSKGIAGTTETWSGEDENGIPNSTYSKDHKKSFIANRLISKKTNPEGKLVIYLFDGKPVEVEGMSDEEITKLLDKKYDEAKDAQTNIARDIVTLFEHPNEPPPRTLINRLPAIGVLLKGISQQTHTLSVAQGWMQSFYGIGPDVLIAKNNLTGALTFLSAVTTNNTPVKFKTAGDGKPRTSILGKYKTDEELVSGSLNEALMSEPRSHDFLSMKLGIAAMYLRRRYGNNLKIDGMRVVSMGFNTSVEYTETSMAEEVIKLGRFRQAAGTDFPTEYSELLDELNSEKFIGTSSDHLNELMLRIANNSDPLGKLFNPQLKVDIKDKWTAYNGGDKMMAWELKQLLGTYLQAVANKLRASKQDEALILDPAFVMVSKALLELEQVDFSLKQTAADRNSTAAINGAVSSGDKIQIRFHVMYNEASARIRSDMDKYYKEHKKIYGALLKEKGLDFIGNTDKAFSNMYMSGKGQQYAMTLKPADDPSLSKAESAYIKFFNEHMYKVLLRISAPKFHEDIKNGRFWEPGTVPIIMSSTELLEVKNFTSWQNLKSAISAKVKSMRKKTKQITAESFMVFDFATKFDNQATDTGVGHSRVRRQALGLLDPNVPTEPNPNIEKNLALILNMANLEAAEKSNYRILLQSLVAAQSVLAAENDRARTGMTVEMIDTWRDLVIFNTYKKDPIADFTDPLNRLSSEMLFSYSIRQAMIEASTGTLQTGSLLIANSVKNAYAAFFSRPEHAGRFDMTDFAWGIQAWNKYSAKINQIVYDHGMLVADADDMRNTEFEAANKVEIFKSEAGFWLNRLFFNSAITHTFLAQIRHLGIDQAYNEDGIYDETKDPRFFVYDPESNLGTRGPVGEEEMKKYSLWKATRESLAAEGMIDMTTKRMKIPMTSNQRAEIKLYATRAYGSFNKDAVIHGEAYTIMRSMIRYKKWAFQKVANYWTPTVHDEALYGHWEQIPDGKGGFITTWKGDDFQGILQTLGHIAKEIAALRAVSMTKNLNKYQLENLSKLLADLTLFLMMLLIMLPLLKDTEEEISQTTGEVKNVKGEFGKSVFGDSAYKAATNATSDLFVLLGISNLTSSIFPGLGVMGSTAATAFKAASEALQGKDTAGETLMTAANKTGAIRTFNIISETLEGKSN